MKTFAAMDIGSYEMELKIFEISEKKKVKQIDGVRHRLDLGTETHETGRLSNEKVSELCRVLKGFSSIADTYKVKAYRAYGTSAMREIKNQLIVLSQIESRTGIHIDVPSNSEQRFINLKAVAATEPQFEDIIEKNTVIVDAGGAGLQISYFENGKLATTCNLPLGILSLRERLRRFDVTPTHYDRIINELALAPIQNFIKLYVKDKNIENLILVDEYINVAFRSLLSKSDGHHMSCENYIKRAESLKSMAMYEAGKLVQMPEDGVELLYISNALVTCIVNGLGIKDMWLPGATLCDGMAYEYAEKNKLITFKHDFEEDILSSAKIISKRYQGSKKRGETLEKIALTVFDTMKKVHVLGKRERMLLRISALLHDCGRYISIFNPGEAGYGIIMATEIIGISHKEREMVAKIIKYAYEEFAYVDLTGENSDLDVADLLVIAKLAAILRLATGLDRGHKEKFKELTAKLDMEKDTLILGVAGNYDISLEKNLFSSRAEFFQEVYRITPVINQVK